MNLIEIDGQLYERVFPRYAGEYEPAPERPEVSTRVSEPRYGTYTTPASVLEMHEQRRAKALELIGRGVGTVNELADELMVSTTRVYEVMRALVADGLVTRELESVSGIGRPTYVHRLVK